jgi:putative radical SAM enzyme (TIGR03279 family)
MASLHHPAGRRRLGGRGVAVVGVEPGSAADQAGVRRGDRLLRVNGEPVRDALDFRWLTAAEEVTLEVAAGEAARTVRLSRGPHESFGIGLAPPRWRACRNRCVFCFMDQLPPGLRRSLYFKDEDYRLSFLRGSYVTLTDLTQDDIERILTQRLSPLYVSVHTTDPDLRARMLGRPGATPVMPLLRRLADGGIQTHAQVVLCPGINDDSVLDRAIEELSSLHPGVASLAVVPVGLTAHRDGLEQLVPVGRSEATAALDQINGWRKRLSKARGTRFVHAADELYLLAGRRIPSARQYEGFPQIEDGVGMTRVLTDRLRRALRRLPAATRRNLGEGKAIVTGQLAAPLLQELLDGTRVEVVPVENRLLGGGVTVSGLLAGQDLVAEAARLSGFQEVLLPSDLLNADGLLLDDWTPARLGRELGVRVRVVPFLGEGLVAALKQLARS